METDFKTKVIWYIVAVAFSAFCIYSMIEPLNRQAKESMRKNPESPYPGPFDEAMAKTMGEPDCRKHKTQWNGIPVGEPLKLTPLKPIYVPLPKPPAKLLFED